MPQPDKERSELVDDKLWYKDAVIYQLHVKSFFDANNDGQGDFAGLIAKLDYIASLGVNTVWLLPFYPSPRLDDGYDIAEYRGVHEDYGSLADVRRFIKAAHERGLRVITELVVNHTSDQHPWFQRARHAKPGSAARNFYVWADNDQGYADTRIIFCDTEKSNWTWDPVAGAYFWHRFYSHQPDLNYDNPRVLKALIGIMRYWLDMGVDGLRLDAVPYLVEREGTNNENLPETHGILRRIRAVMDREYPDRMLLAEANQWPEDAQEYFGDGDECHMSFHFPLMPRMYMAIARADRFPITDIMQQTPEIPENCQWAIFLRNHDELTLEMVTSSERDYLWDVYAADRRARINLGIRRRLSPLLERDRRRIELMNSLLLSMPGTPVLYYGDEIGMGDNIHLGDRDGVRTPMQWSPDRNGGFSRADPERLSLPVLMGPLYGYEAVNVEAQQRDPHSLLNWTRRMLAKRQQTHVFGRGSLRFLYPGNRKILAYLREHEGLTVLCVANLSNASQPVELDLSALSGRVPIELLGGTPFPTIGELPYLLTLPPYGFYWFELSPSAAPPAWHASGPQQMPEYITLVWRRRPSNQLVEGSRRALCEQVLPQYLERQRWFPGAGPVGPARIGYITPLPASDASQAELFLAEFEVDGNEAAERYFLPLALLWGEAATSVPAQHGLAQVRRGAELALAADAYAVPDFTHAMLDAWHRQLEINIEGSQPSTLIFRAEPGFDATDWPADLEINWFHGEQSNSSVVLGDIAVLKLIRHVVPGMHPEAEMTRQLTRSQYANSAALLAELLRISPDGTPHTLALVHARIANQGDAWTWTQDYLTGTLEDAALTGESRDDFQEELRSYATVAATIGKRLAELHRVLAQPADDLAFQPEVAEKRHAQAWAKDIRSMLSQALKALGGKNIGLDERAGQAHDELLSIKKELLAAVDAQAGNLVGTLRTRAHGDFHLGQVLIAQNDVYLIDFEGEPARSLEERRAKTSPWRDVAGLIRSFDYAGASFMTSDTTTAPHGAATDGGASEVQAPAVAALMDQRRSLLDQFCATATEAFLNGYRVAIAEPGSNVEEQQDGEAAMAVMASQDRALLDLALVEKAAYEICYEAAHRPDWIAIPLSGLLRAARRLIRTATDQDSGKETE
ncbi:maltose alpha-D-glucosyltransferase [Pollutimonas thiosulfatoxidans]|uniref:maltose alpha-D-glucosyltransferase n=1 Tax=Pollutimonas thiosulfatoxidans TaxID=2028345 RepID=A0A410GFQ4_9BURK|nr:maltose alpha-D-glucosyltransferase [Pollutimonas thiosulfatoxidans]QAA95136.1 maltose alpha-D-glucosyltransferase [Pollutimonas thiosulfatoxidans]